MKFRIECDDDLFGLVLILPTGEEMQDEPVAYFSVSTVVAPGGKVCGVYMTGSEPEFVALEDDPSPDAVTVEAKQITVYDLEKWPTLVPIPAQVTLQLTTLSEPEEGDDEDDNEPIDIDVVPA